MVVFMAPYNGNSDLLRVIYHGVTYEWNEDYYGWYDDDGNEASGELVDDAFYVAWRGGWKNTLGLGVKS